ncbi:hypothetical protein F5Y13DRAFT_206509 [Hypoxylon sp. FL1857]|nr:hypothetical protein F5Y13DRAFT_206509 [Hypoxylon sp. FL1857]
MTSDSNNAAYNGMTPSKPNHRFSENPPTPGPVDSQSLRAYRLASYENGADSVPLPNVRLQEPGDIKAAHKARAAAALRAIQDRLG